MNFQNATPFYVTAAGLVSAILIGWLLMVGQSLIVPIVIAIISVYLLSATSTALGSLVPPLAYRPRLRSFVVLIVFVGIIIVFALFLVRNAQSIAAALPNYSDNLNTMFAEISESWGVKDVPTVSSLVALISDRLDFGGLAQTALGTLSSVGSVIIMAICYAVFLSADLNDMPRKLQLAMGSETSAKGTIALVLKINKRIGDYLIAKTTVNAILAVASLAIMLLLGIEFAVLWAVLIGLLNYIPYIGSIIGVVFPVILSLAQFGSVGPTLAALVGLMGVQLYVGYVLEPRLLGKSVNLSAFFVLLALSFWTTLWGAIGAILAVPLTAVVMIILAEMPALRPIAILISDDGEV